MKRTFYMALVILLLLSPSSALAANGLLAKANQAFDAKDYRQALELYEQVIAQNPKNLDAISWASTAAKVLHDDKKEIFYLKKLKKADPNGMKPREMLMQAYQRQADGKNFELERSGLIALYNKYKTSRYKDKKHFVRDTFKAGLFKVVVFEYFSLEGNFAKRYHFLGQKRRDTLPFTVSLGSYPAINKIEKEMGRLKDGQRLFHLDGYDGKRHYTYAFMESEPSYKEIKNVVIKIFKTDNPKKKSMSSSAFKGGLLP